MTGNREFNGQDQRLRLVFELLQQKAKVLSPHPQFAVRWCNDETRCRVVVAIDPLDVNPTVSTLLNRPPRDVGHRGEGQGVALSV